MLFSMHLDITSNKIILILLTSALGDINMISKCQSN